MKNIILPIISLALYVIGFFTANIILIIAALVLAVISFCSVRKIRSAESIIKICYVGSISLIAVGAIYFAVLAISILIMVPILNSIF